MTKLKMFCVLIAAIWIGAWVDAQVLKGKAAFGGWRDDKPGVRRHFTMQDQQPPSKSSLGPAEVVPMPAGAKVMAPEGFIVELVSNKIRKPRVVRVAPNGDLFIAESMKNTIHVIRLSAGGSKPAAQEVFASGLFQPYGMAFYPVGPNPQWLYVANSDSLIRFPYKNGDLKASGKPERLVEKIPHTHHYGRDLVFSPDGQRLFLSVGSGSNAAQDMFPEPRTSTYPEPHMVEGVQAWSKEKPLGATWDTEELRANVLAFDANGKNMKIFATGLRNCQGMAIQPATSELWCVVNERDEIGDNTPFEYATHVREGAFYGWPWFFNGANEDPRHPGRRPDLRDKITLPDVLIQPHSAPLQIAFYNADHFPAEYKGSAFVAMHGSWNRADRTGYKVVRLLFDAQGKPTGEYEDFLTGFVVSDQQVWGRPVGVAVGKDGSLIVTEDGNGAVWRVSRKS